MRKYAIVPTSWSVMKQYWQEQPKRARSARFPKTEEHEEQFIEAVYTSPYCFNFAAVHVESKQIAGEFTLSQKSHLTSQIHFSIHRKWYGKSLDVARDALCGIFELTDQYGRLYVTTLIGVTPVVNSLASKFKKRLGFKTLCIIPDMFLSGAAEISMLRKSEWDLTL